ncbi:MAG: hypothetical protein LT102_07375 [Burkholderiaceae bacterium]|nr:hypothetical protein [Burkholderiaceae bacterium]
MQGSRPTPLASIGRRAAHAVGIALGWALFVYGWMRVAARPWDAHELWVLIVASAIVLPTSTAFWIVHNVALYRGRHRRRGTALVECRYDVDWSGRAVEADWSTLASADRIWIDVEDGAKRYRSFLTVPLPPADDATPVSRDSTHYASRGPLSSASLGPQAAS